MVLDKMRGLLSISGYMEKMMGNFVESTGADTNTFIYNFKKDHYNSVYAQF